MIVSRRTHINTHRKREREREREKEGREEGTYDLQYGKSHPESLGSKDTQIGLELDGLQIHQVQGRLDCHVEEASKIGSVSTTTESSNWRVWPMAYAVEASGVFAKRPMM
jgi:predicted transposase YdaD